MGTGRSDRGPDELRRKLLKTSILLAGASALTRLPYEKPTVKSFLAGPTAYARPTGPTQNPGDGAPTS